MEFSGRAASRERAFRTSCRTGLDAPLLRGCRNDGTLTASAGGDGPTRPHLLDCRGHVAVGAATSERDRRRRR
jgi:hypothetical protein